LYQNCILPKEAHNAVKIYIVFLEHNPPLRKHQSNSEKTSTPSKKCTHKEKNMTQQAPSKIKTHLAHTKQVNKPEENQSWSILDFSAPLILRDAKWRKVHSLFSCYYYWNIYIYIYIYI
jgi:hypothetical protein